MQPQPTGAELLHAVLLLASCDHFDVSRRAARTLPPDLPLVDVLKAADGATRLARALDVTRRTAA